MPERSNNFDSIQQNNRRESAVSAPVSVPEFLLGLGVSVGTLVFLMNMIEGPGIVPRFAVAILASVSGATSIQASRYRRSVREHQSH